MLNFPQYDDDLQRLLIQQPPLCGVLKLAVHVSSDKQFDIKTFRRLCSESASIVTAARDMAELCLESSDMP